MKQERIIEELARIEFGAFITIVDGHVAQTVDGPYNRPVNSIIGRCPTYNTYDDMHRIIGGMDEETLNQYAKHLCMLMLKDGERFAECAYVEDNLMEALELTLRALQATVAQMQEAALKAYGRWEQE